MTDSIDSPAIEAAREDFAPESVPLHAGEDNGATPPERPHVKARVEAAMTRLRALEFVFSPQPVQCNPFCTIAQAAVGVLDHARKRLQVVEALTEDGAPYDQFYSDLIDLRSNLRAAIRYLELVETAGA